MGGPDGIRHDRSREHCALNRNYIRCRNINVLSQAMQPQRQPVTFQLKDCQKHLIIDSIHSRDATGENYYDVWWMKPEQNATREYKSYRHGESHKILSTPKRYVQPAHLVVHYDADPQGLETSAASDAAIAAYLAKSSVSFAMTLSIADGATTVLTMPSNHRNAGLLLA